MCEKMMKIRQAICPLRRFYYRHHAISEAGVCIHPDVPILILFLLLVSFRETTWHSLSV